MNKRDFMLTACLLAAAGLLFIFFRGKPSGELSVVTARVDGKVVGSWQVDTDSEQEINTEYGHNRIRISGRSVRMIEADCPDGYCMQQNAIGSSGGSIICLPHHLVVEMSGGDVGNEAGSIGGAGNEAGSIGEAGNEEDSIGEDSVGEGSIGEGLDAVVR